MRALRRPVVLLSRAAPRASARRLFASDADPYSVLGVRPGASADEIKKAYRAEALRWHPDRHSGGDDEARELAELNFKRINRAHAILADAGRRRQFDLGARAQDLA